MIVSRRGGALELVEQVEHGRVAGELAGAWGNEEFEVPTPLHSVRTAAARHDEGWRAWDARVLFDELERRPLHFTDIDAGEHIRLYRQGVEQVSLADVYSGVLVGMHWTGLYRGRWSAPGAAARVGRSPEDRRLQDEVVAAEEQRWIGAKRLAWTDDEPRSVFETQLWHNYELLQFWDLLSLYLAVTPPDEAGTEGVPPQPWGPQLRRLEHGTEPVLLPPVPLRPGGGRIAVTASVRAPGTVALDPFPFRAPLEVAVERVLVPDRGWSHEELVARLRRTRRSTTTWRLVPADGARS
ncbi:DUF3891 family protein [Blastococcus sp. VKM Ac-2987]|uniref:DUF3891 family protein n=1 Tax=Blastococcus sp. VKM Ac-2987 TaxID=3004141 RepID=UPI0022ABBE1E|nr:DUF3891 family protein [Blastococcus sp. VKM Ac-2987]MCZ2859105.1 DUF3891 family protein [Blastococcus sp. VKM Ac-2987]